MRCAVGVGTDQAWAALRAGIGRITNSRIIDAHLEPVRMGLVPEIALGELTPEIDRLPLPSRARRMLRLAAPSFDAVASGAARPVPVFIGLPELAPDEAPWLLHVPAYLQQLTGVPVDRTRSQVVPEGRAAALMALERALECLESGGAEVVVVGGVDSFLDFRLLARMGAEKRILGAQVMDGFIPGEGAAFFVLSGSDQVEASEPQVVVDAAASAMDSGHRYSDEPARGEGLSAAVELLRARLSDAVPTVATTFAGFNGESFESKLWGVARLRHHELFRSTMMMEHPADKFGDAGAAMGAILVALAAKALASGARPGPALVWAASDREPRACAVMSVASD